MTLYERAMVFYLRALCEIEAWWIRAVFTWRLRRAVERFRRGR